MKFEVKSAEEIGKMSAEELHTYYLAKEKHTSEQLEVRMKALEDTKGTEDYKALATEVKELRDEQIAALKAVAVEQGKVIEALKNGSINANNIQEAEMTVEKLLKKHEADFKSSKEGRHDFKFELPVEASHKTVGDMTIGGNVTGALPQAQRLPGVNDIAEKAAVIYGLIPKLNIAGNSVDWVYESGQEGAAGATAEGAAKNQIDNNFVVTSVSLKKYTAYFKVSTEMLDDISFMQSWLRNKLIVRLFIEVNDAILNDTGSGSTLTGILSLATAFSAGSFANAVDNANDVDSLVVAINQVKLANHATNNLAVLMYPSDVAALKMVKVTSTDKRYVERLMNVGSTLMIDGYPIIESTQITEGDFLVCDFGKALIIQKRGIEIQVGLDGNDLTKNMRTIVAEWRGQVVIQNNDRTGFVKGTFATTNAALETA